MLYDKKLQEKGLSTVHIAKLIVNIKRRADALALGLPYEEKWQRTTLENNILFVNRARGLSQSPPCVVVNTLNWTSVHRSVVEDPVDQQS